jgi:hypothetical protein
LKILDMLKGNPVMVRSVIVAALSLAATFVPQLAGVEANETVIGVLVAAVALVLGKSAHNKVTPVESADAREEAAQVAAMAVRRDALGDPEGR